MLQSKHTVRNVLSTVLCLIVLGIHIPLIVNKKSFIPHTAKNSINTTLHISKSTPEKSNPIYEKLPPQKIQETIAHTESPIKIDDEQVPEQEIEEQQIPEEFQEQNQIQDHEQPDMQNSNGNYLAENTDEGSVQQGVGDVPNIEHIIVEKIYQQKIYPRAARKRGLQGDVEISFTVNIDGSLENISVVRSTGATLLTDAALASVKNAFPLNFSVTKKITMQVTLRYELS